MEIKMKCPVCGEEFEEKLDDLEIEYDDDGDVMGIATIEFLCQGCEKSFYIGG